jgi:N-acetylglutamate synthase-like GNAT family acetyltransferase
MTSSSIDQTAAAIRPATEADLPRITALLVASDLPTVGVAEALSRFFVAESNDRIVGVVGLESCCDRYALLRSTAVHDDWRGRGLGRKLVERAIAEAEAEGIEALSSRRRRNPAFELRFRPRDEMTPTRLRRRGQLRPASATVWFPSNA